jgi:hypothetical protein
LVAEDVTFRRRYYEKRDQLKNMQTQTNPWNELQITGAVNS